MFSESAHTGKSFAFGSSTPREFSHLNKIRPALRVYDAKIVHKAQQKPTRSPSLSVAARRPRSISHNAQHVVEKVEDDIASEPDIVQDRRYDFSEFREQHRQQILENEKKELKSRTSTAEESTFEVEETQDLSTEAQQSVQVMKQADELLPHDHLVTVPVVQAPEMANPVLLEDNHVENFEENDANHSYEVKNLGDLGDLDLVKTLAQESGRYASIENQQENE
uniref:Uncharacterized protein n=1 Tax=Panagrolaimus sp. ES5 TaxID=591445 RepID=A0AC34GVW6_9BILA